jgi:ABC-type lipoprotein export system ATPase subunit
MKLTFQKIVRENVFSDDFLHMVRDNDIEFPESGIAVVYGPNGIGKSSLAYAFAGEEGAEYSLVYDGVDIHSSEEPDLFHVINDQNRRNIIQGETKDFILGDNIRREYELKEEIEQGFEHLFNSVLIERLKTDFGISKKNAPLIDKIENKSIRAYVADLVNRKSKGGGIDRSDFLTFVQNLSPVLIPEYEEDKLRFILEDINDKKSIVDLIWSLVDQDSAINEAVTRVEEHSDAVAMLKKYYYLQECVVCDNEIERDELLRRKDANREAILEGLDEETKKIIESVQNRVGSFDPFLIKKAIMESTTTGNSASLRSLVIEFTIYIKIINKMMVNLFASCLEGLNLVNAQEEYDELVAEKPELTSEDVLFIESFANDCIDRKIELVRDDGGNLQLLLGEEPFLNKNRKELRLSNGEQNFISIAFELLKAQKVDSPIVVLDDPISSFDSIFKNKIVYAIAKFLKDKKQILLTHNTDLIKLLEHQKSHSFNLYILNNSEGERNGFVSVSQREQDLLLYLHKLVEFFRDDVRDFIVNEHLFLVALVPFMRSFSRIVNKPDITDGLTSIMHGYGDNSVDLARSYNELFGASFITGSYEVSVHDILGMDVKSAQILDNNEFPLLNRALFHGVNYLWLRLHVEKTLVDLFGINTRRYDQLSRIIMKAFNEDDLESKKGRVFLLSRKTLINEFNHFEQDLNVFQPALDITDTALERERERILCGFLNA